MSRLGPIEIDCITDTTTGLIVNRLAKTYQMMMMIVELDPRKFSFLCSFAKALSLHRNIVTWEARRRVLKFDANILLWRAFDWNIASIFFAIFFNLEYYL